ncbi:Possible hemagglutinin (DUF637) [Moraxella atlantae]|uniref:Possible hemagglutinin (DUF637) n=2 Tax=Faucicola atlantae TaxID=34059 RepID=A0A378QQZ4_9GAMM|nr:Possible hemagglutinin (DUF637) [Moraxella atlantae]
MEKADKQQHDRVLFDSITGAIYGPNSNGATGYVARAVAPEVSYQIGQYFKGTNSEGSAPHILAHGILAAAVSAVTGNDVTTGALSAMGAEAAAPMVAKFLFGDKPISELSADEKATVSSITSLGRLGVGASTGDVGSAVSAGEAAKVATQDNGVEVAAPVCGPLVEVCFVGGVAITAATVYANTPEGKKKIGLWFKKYAKRKSFARSLSKGSDFPMVRQAHHEWKIVLAYFSDQCKNKVVV